MSLSDPRLRSLRARERESALLVGLGGVVFALAGAAFVVQVWIRGPGLGEQLGSTALGLGVALLGVSRVRDVVKEPRASLALRWITTERDQVRGWKIRPNWGQGALETQVILYPKKGEDVTFALVKGEEAPVLAYLTEHLRRLDG